MTTVDTWKRLVAQFGDAYDSPLFGKGAKVLPAGYDDYSCVLHALITEDDEREPYEDRSALTWEHARFGKRRGWSEAGGDELAERLDDRRLGPVLWFPKTLEWVCATPWDAWETFIASTGGSG